MASVDPGTLETILTLCLLIFAAKVGGEAAQRFGVAAVVGELMAGIALGPSLLGNLAPLGFQPILVNETVRAFAEVGAIVLLFVAGMETRLAEFRKIGVLAASVAIGGVVLPFALGYGLMVSRGTTTAAALLAGATLTATSIAITVKVLRDLGKEKEPEAKVLVSAAVMDDILGLVALAVVLSVIAEGGIRAGEAISIAVEAVGFWLLLTVAGALLLPRIVTRTVPWVRARGTLEASAMALCFGYAYLAGVAGLAPILGAFAAGMAIAETKITIEIKEFAEKVSFLVAPLFFTVVGTLVDLSSLSGPSVLLALELTLLAILGKVVGCGLPAYAFSREMKAAAIVGVGMVSRGEVGLIIAGIGATSGVFSREVFSAIVLMVVITTVLTPIPLKRLYQQPIKKV
ncbi:MAG: cation:proton antiporter [Euryarchaeota archaeon]|nr:cation:proton antiporter [Euryarchaeota archaeon]